MDFGNKIMKLRKKSGLTQEELAEKVGVARQTISKWELGETVPDLQQSKKLSKIFNISLDELTDNEIKNILIEKVTNTEQTTKKSFTILKLITIVIIIFILLFIILLVARIVNKNIDKGRKLNSTIHCNLYGEEHSFEITYYELTEEPIELGGDAYFADILDLQKYNDAHQIFNIINDYVKKNNGNCYIINNNDLNDIVNISIKDNSLTKSEATIIITEAIDYDILYGEPFWIEKYNYRTNSFEILKNTTGNNCAFNLPAYGVTPEKSLELKQNWSCMHGQLEKGLYRIVKAVYFNSDVQIANNHKYYIWVEFEIEE